MSAQQEAMQTAAGTAGKADSKTGKRRSGKGSRPKLPPWTLFTPYGLIFIVFIIIPVVAAVGLSFTYFNTIEPPRFVGLQNYIDLFTIDSTFLRYVVPNTIIYALFVGVGGYILSFFLAWSLSQLTHRVRTVMAGHSRIHLLYLHQKI